MFFVGVDLAWSTKNGSGVTVLKGAKKKAELVDSRVLFSDEDILDFIDSSVGASPCFVSIDAPLIVPNEEGRRLAEARVGDLFRKFNAGAHPSNRKRLSSWTGSIRGEELSRKLESLNFKHSPEIERFEESRKFFEVYPHPSIVVLFELNSILKYKAKPKRDYDFRWREFEKFQEHLKGLENATPSLVLPASITERKVSELKGKALKEFEDVLDSVFCAYLSYYAWSKPEKCAVLGSMKEGYILTPVFDYQLKDLQAKQTRLGEF